MFLLKGFFSKIIRTGTLTLIGPRGDSHVVGSGEPFVSIRITNAATARHILLNADMAIGEAFMDGSLIVEQGDIYGFLDLCFANLGWGYGHWARYARAIVRRIARPVIQYNPIGKARENVAHHYDLSDALYELFLDANRQYSCAYFMTPDDTLEAAQAQKMRHIAAKLLLKPNQRVLDIGSGWGGLALHVAQTEGVDVTGITLSTEQHGYAQHRADAAGVSDRVRFLLQDYREATGQYDRIVSVGMFEHVGIDHYRTYFARIRDLLTDDGVALVHTIGSASGPGAGSSWLNRYIFPGGYSPAMSEIVPHIESAGLYITDIEVLRLHYAETLKAWRRRFDEKRHIAAKLYDERFCRMWEFYLAACEAAFRHAGLVVFQIQLSKRVDAVPMTRDYITDWERRGSAR
ncbi:cyclopropane-fatty-acyl-phospholipid synthase [Humitalea rosea]|uniref:Cyclopropane-fatty-acyl-phospholipid synthase n=1 Tax=Humitalea rosea TaxID=990373 RepID=A0A2W7HVI0_9PROT|nr:cyclopropane-fatty-acyl-phospholipid synthase family protein [Humitalea rosea]PZW36991.1 cyclopropane-fatty-acyl-phospholipid synthase [Humitalea rosea]